MVWGMLGLRDVNKELAGSVTPLELELNKVCGVNYAQFSWRK